MGRCHHGAGASDLSILWLDDALKQKREGNINYEKSKLGQHHIVFALVMTPASTTFVHVRG